VDIVKLDGAFCDNLSGNPDNQYFVRSLVDLAHNLDLRIVAEWVQTEQDAELLRGWGVDYFQGRLYGLAQIGHPWPSPRLSSHEGFHAVAAERDKPEEEPSKTDADMLSSPSERAFGKRRADAAQELASGTQEKGAPPVAGDEAEDAGPAERMETVEPAELRGTAGDVEDGGTVMEPEVPATTAEQVAENVSDAAQAVAESASSAVDAAGNDADDGLKMSDAAGGISTGSITEALSTLERELQDLRQLLAAMRGAAGRGAGAVRNADESSAEAERMRGNG